MPASTKTAPAFSSQSGDGASAAGATPYHGGWGGNGGHGADIASTFFLQIGPSRRVDRVRACPRVLSLMYPSRTRVALSVLKTYNTVTGRRDGPCKRLVRGSTPPGIFCRQVQNEGEGDPKSPHDGSVAVAQSYGASSRRRGRR